MNDFFSLSVAGVHPAHIKASVIPRPSPTHGIFIHEQPDSIHGPFIS